MVLDLLLAVVGLVVAAALRPWRAVGPGGPPASWLACWAAMPLLWAGDLLSHSTLAPLMSGACLLVLMAGWPLAMLGIAAAAGVVAALAGLEPLEVLHRAVWQGVVPATLAMALGGAVRRWLPRHLFVYILCRGFAATLAALSLAGWAALALGGTPEGLSRGDAVLARWLAAWGEAIVTGMLVAVFVAFRPQWLATYADRLYLPGAPR